MQDTRHLVQIGDYFIITKPSSDNEVWNEVNRFETCQLVGIEDNGRWVFKEMFYEYAKGDYPFWSDSFYWDVFRFAQDCLIQRIDDPETEGFKQRKPFLQDKIQNRIRELQKEYRSVASYVAYNAIKQGKLIDYIDRLDKIVGSLAIHGVEASSDVIPLGDVTLPYVSTMVDGHKLTGSILTMYRGSFDINTWAGVFNVKFGDLIPNDELYPIDFSWCHPYSSVMQSCEAESLACRILLFTSSWDNLPTWEEYYNTMTSADKQVSQRVKADFDYVINYLSSPEKCAEFSPAWAELYRNFMSTKEGLPQDKV